MYIWRTMAAKGNSVDFLSDETFDDLCTVCKVQDKNTEAGLFCVDCHDYYCTNCVKFHYNVPALMGHNILSKDQHRSGVSQGHSMAPTERCHKHSYKHIDMYCQGHDKVCCSTCIALDHRSCDDIFFIPEYVQRFPNKVSTRQTHMELEAAMETLKERTDKLKQEKQRLLKRKADLVNDIKRLRQELNKKLDDLEKKSINDIEENSKSIVDTIDDCLKQIESKKGDFSISKSKVASSNKNITEVFVNIKLRQNIKREADNFIEEIVMPIKDIDVSFTADKCVSSLLKQLNSFGKVTVKSSNASGNKHDAPTKPMTAKLRPKCPNKYNIKDQSDDMCDIVSACALNDGTIVIADYENLKLKWLRSSDFTIKGSINLNSSPWQVCVIDQHRVAVSVENRIIIASLTYKTKRTEEIQNGFTCFGLAYANGTLFASDFVTSPASVHLLTLSGTVLKQINKDTLGKNLFETIRSLAVSKDGSKLYVIDRSKGPMVLDRDGHVLGRFEIVGASGCCLNEEGNLIVTCKDSRNVLQLEPNCEFIGEIAKFTEEEPAPRAICCNKHMSKLIIGRYSSNTIEVYDI